LFQIYKHLTKNNPCSYTILLCNKETTIEELTSFLYRAILCEYNSCFIIEGIEFLEYNKKSKLLEILNKLYIDDYENMKSCLIILYTTRTTDIFKSLNALKYKKILDIKKKDFENVSIKSNVEIISSDFSGVGKSTEIKRSIEKENKKYIYFPLGGVLIREEIVKRLKNLNISKDSTIHLDLYDTDQTDLMKEFLFSVLITKLYGKNEDIFYLLNEVEIKIEIPNRFCDYFKKYPILTLFPHKKLSIYKLPPLIVEADINSNIQIVANYIKALKSDIIDKKDLYFENLSPKIFSTYKKTKYDAIILSQQECQQLIFNEIMAIIKIPNYYQITSFINILAEELIKFSNSLYFEAHTLIKNKKLTARKSIIENFIKTARYFIQTELAKIAKRQKIIYNNLYGLYNENKDNSDGIEDLTKYENEIVSFEKLESSLFFFHEGNGERFSIITNKSDKDEEYQKLLIVKNCQVSKKKNYINLSNYKSYSQFDFLRELKQILNIDNKVTEEEAIIEEMEEEEVEEEDQEEEDENAEKNKCNNKKLKKKLVIKKSLEKIAKNYIFTPDNFLKMILILLRIRANMPVIMMGETGCGKTSLIKKLSEMLNNGSLKNMKILNIHAGINDKDIINFLERKVIIQAIKLGMKEDIKKLKFIQNNKFYNPKKLWVFFDEINTCKSMDLISEIICKHSYKGNPLPPNIVFISACNPYREAKKNPMNKIELNVKETNNGLKNLNQKELEGMKKSANKHLAYAVNPLPNSLLNFVLDFGNLTQEDEERYIKSTIFEPIIHLIF